MAISVLLFQLMFYTIFAFLNYFYLKVHFLLSRKLLIDAIKIDKINANSYLRSADWTNVYTNPNCMPIPKEVINRYNPYCFKVGRMEKFLSSKVHNLFSIKLEALEMIIPMKVALTYQTLDMTP